MTIERAIEILDPEHREHYESIETVNEACLLGIDALKNVEQIKADNDKLRKLASNLKKKLVKAAKELQILNQALLLACDAAFDYDQTCPGLDEDLCKECKFGGDEIAPYCMFTKAIRKAKTLLGEKDK